MLPNEMPDHTLISRFKSGNEEAFKVVYEKYSAKIYRFVYSFLKNKEQTEEVVQEAFLNIWINREKLNEQSPLEPYLFTVSKRLVIDTFRKATSTEKLRATLFAGITEANNLTEENIIFSDLMRFTEKAISKLPKQQQIVFRLSRFEGLSYEEIATQLNISKHTVKNHLIVALKAIKSQFDHHDILYTLALLFYALH
ncbi:MAG: RNA polymerase sigma-70 factor [Pedobacter sp.]|nr:MAG: RNA polymerase sigma-70 factor [Pedobacter sp.]